MDYKYIEQLLERYWQCDTSIEEEQILHAFFCQKEIPTELRKYRDLFAGRLEMLEEETLSDDFDAKILSITEGTETVKAREINIRQRLMPLFKAAAAVAIIITLGNAAQLSMNKSKGGDEINYASYQDTFSDPTVAYDNVEEALELVSECFNMSQGGDSTKAVGPAEADSAVNE